MMIIQFLYFKGRNFHKKKLSQEETFAVSRFLAKSAKVYSHEIFQKSSSAKVYSREIFQKSSSAKVYFCRHLQIFGKNSTLVVTVYNCYSREKNDANKQEYKLHVMFC